MVKDRTSRGKKKSSGPIKLLYVYILPIQKHIYKFATHVPIRLMNQMEGNIVLHVLYSGEMDSARLKGYGIICHQFTGSKIGRWISLAACIRRMIRLYRIQIVSNVWSHYFVIILKLATISTNASVVARVSGDPTNLRRVSKTFSYARIRKSFAYLAEKYSLRFADGVYFVSQELHDRFMSRYTRLPRNRCAVISQGVDLDAFPYRYKKYDKPTKLLFVGRLNKKKGIGVLLLVFAKLSREYPELRLNIVGPGKRPEIPTEIKSTVRLSGMIDHGNLKHIYAEADFLVLPSISEGLPNVVLEAMASGIVVVAAKTGDIPCLLGSGRGYLIPSNSFEDIYSTIKLALSANAEELEKVCKNAREYIVRNHSFLVTRNRIHDFWHKQVGVDS